MTIKISACGYCEGCDPREDQDRETDLAKQENYPDWKLPMQTSTTQMNWADGFLKSTSTVIDKYWTFRYRGLTHRPSWQSPCEREWYRKRNILAIWILGPPYGLWLAIGVSPKDHQDGLLVKGDWHLKKKYPIYLDIRAAIRALAGKLQETGKPSKTGQGVSSISKFLRS